MMAEKPRAWANWPATNFKAIGESIHRLRWVHEGVLSRSLVSQALVDMHAGSVDAGHRLGHEGGVQTVELRNSLEGVRSVTALLAVRQRITVLEVDLVLADATS